MTTLVSQKENVPYLQGVINHSRDLNTDLNVLVNRVDGLCNRLGRSEYSKNHSVAMEGENKTNATESDGLMDEFQAANNRKLNLINDLRIAIEYLEQHI